jgi:acetylornithine deacetylase/succinyl-diaminopimelate desuccinylase-like protein
MTSAANALPAVLAHIDADLDNSLNRLFDLVRIPSISTDSAFKDSCKAAADFVAKDLQSLGFEATVRPTAGHPVVTATSNGATAPNNGPRVLFYGHYDVQPVDPARSVEHAAVRAEGRQPARRPQDHPRRGACDDKGQFMTFVEACAPSRR